METIRVAAVSMSSLLGQPQRALPIIGASNVGPFPAGPWTGR
jgi:hypothetical protein